MNDSISDISLFARVNPADTWLNTVKENLPAELLKLLSIIEDNKIVGFHITLFEFFHSKGVEDHLFMDNIVGSIDNPGWLTEKLKNEVSHFKIDEIPLMGINFNNDSLQLLVKGLFFSDNTKKKNVNSDICKACDKLLPELSLRYGAMIKATGMPNPLHITLLHLGQTMKNSFKLKKIAQEWANSNKNKIWGNATVLDIILAKAKKSPYNDVESISVIS